jgi:hypothetical protein
MTERLRRDDGFEDGDECSPTLRCIYIYDHNAARWHPQPPQPPPTGGDEPTEIATREEPPCPPEGAR